MTESAPVDPQAVVNDLAQQVAQQAVGLAMLRSQLAQVTRERDLLLAEQEKTQSNYNENTEGGLP